MPRTTLALAAIVFVCPSFGWAQTLDRILAVVSGHVILASDVRTFLEFGLIDVDRDAEAEHQMLEKLILRRLAIDEVDRYQVGLPQDDRLKRDLALLENRFATKGEFSAALDYGGLTYHDVIQILQDNARVEAYINGRFPMARYVEEAELREFYELKKDEIGENGRSLTFEEARAALLECFLSEERSATVDEWLATLFRRSEVIRFGY